MPDYLCLILTCGYVALALPVQFLGLIGFIYHPVRVHWIEKNNIFYTNKIDICLKKKFVSIPCFLEEIELITPSFITLGTIYKSTTANIQINKNSNPQILKLIINKNLNNEVNFSFVAKIDKTKSRISRYPSNEKIMVTIKYGIPMIFLKFNTRYDIPLG